MTLLYFFPHNMGSSWMCIYHGGDIDLRPCLRLHAHDSVVACYHVTKDLAGCIYIAHKLNGDIDLRLCLRLHAHDSLCMI